MNFDFIDAMKQRTEINTRILQYLNSLSFNTVLHEFNLLKVWENILVLNATEGNPNNCRPTVNRVTILSVIEMKWYSFITS